MSGKHSAKPRSIGRPVFTTGAAFLLCCGATACVGGPGHFTEAGFKHRVFPYRVDYSDPATHNFAGAGWVLDNYKTDDDGTPGRCKYGPRYYEPLQRMDLVEGMAFAEYYEVGFGKETETHERRFATRIISSKPTKVGGHAAIASTIDIANVDQLKLDPSHVLNRLSMVVLHAPFRWKPGRGGGLGLGTEAFPVLLLITYVNRPAEFDEQLPAFDELLSRVRF